MDGENMARALPQEEEHPEMYVRTAGAPAFKATASPVCIFSSQLNDLT